MIRLTFALVLLAGPATAAECYGTHPPDGSRRPWPYPSFYCTEEQARAEILRQAQKAGPLRGEWRQ